MAWIGQLFLNVTQVRKRLRSLVKWADKFFYHCKDFAGVEKIEGQGCDEVEQEPAFEVVEGDASSLGHDLALLVDERSPEVQDDVCKGFFVVLFSSTRWVRSTIKLLHCPLLSCEVPSINLSNIKRINFRKKLIFEK